MAGQHIVLARASSQAGIDDNRYLPSSLVLRVQELLARIGYYQGALDGRMSPETADAIRQFQVQSGLPLDSGIDQAFVERLQAAAAFPEVQQRLDRATKRQKVAARSALRSNPETRQLLQPTSLLADARRRFAARPCLAAPTVRCLSQGALANVAGIKDARFRDWLLGEIAVAQAAGDTGQAKQTLNAIEDPRLVLNGLREIAAAHARSGRFTKARDIADNIPAAVQRLGAFGEIAVAMARRDRKPAAWDLLQLVFDSLATSLDATSQIRILADLGQQLSAAGFQEAGKACLRRAEDVHRDSQAVSDVGELDTAMAEFWARTGHHRRAIPMLSKLGQASARRGIRIAVAESLMKSGQLAAAREQAALVPEPRYRAPLAIAIALAHAQAGQGDVAAAYLDDIDVSIARIQDDFARSVALARLAEAFLTVGARQRAGEAAALIADPKVRARAYFHLADHWPDAAAQAPRIRHQRLAELAIGRVSAASDRVDLQLDRVDFLLSTGRRHDAGQIVSQSLAATAAMTNAWDRARAFLRLSQVDPAVLQGR